jgi:hypothetical protein
LNCWVAARRTRAQRRAANNPRFKAHAGRGVR